jgi:hypothetical protein
MTEETADVAAELRALRAEVASLREELGRAEGRQQSEASWEEGAAAAPSYAWLSSLEPPARRPLTVPRLLLEAAFLVAVAAVAALAELEPLVIAALMAGAWVLVAFAEWAASRADRHRLELLHAPPPVAPEPVADPAWFAPPVEQTMLDDAVAADSETAIAKLPSLPEGEQTAERRAG